MLEWLQMEQWSPYAVGTGIGILSWFSFLVSDKHISCSTAITRTSGMIEKRFRGKKIENKEYYVKFPPKVQWDWMLLLGVLIGAFISTLLSGSFELRWIPSLWAATFGTAPLPHLVTAFTGGIFLGFASRWTDGCTSGHGISGALQLAVSSWISVIFFFAGGIAAAMLIYHVIGG